MYGIANVLYLFLLSASRSGDVCQMPKLCVQFQYPDTAFPKVLVPVTSRLSADLLRIGGVHHGAVQAPPPDRQRRGRVQVVLANHGATAGEHDPPVGGHGPHALL